MTPRWPGTRTPRAPRSTQIHDRGARCDPRRRVGSVRVERAVRLPLSAAGRGPARRARGRSRTRTGPACCSTDSARRTRPPPSGSIRATAGASCARSRCSPRARRRTARRCPTSPCCGIRRTIIGLTSPRARAGRAPRRSRRADVGGRPPRRGRGAPRTGPRARCHRPPRDRLRAGARPAERRRDTRPRRSPRHRRSRGATRGDRCRGSGATPTSRGSTIGRRCRAPADTGLMTTIRAFTAPRHRVRHRPLASRGPHPLLERSAPRHRAQAHRAARTVLRGGGRSTTSSGR